MTLLSKEQTLFKIMQKMEEETQPNLKTPYDPFNQLVANEFTELQLSSQNTGSINEILRESSKFIKMLAIFNEDGHVSYQYLKTYFNQSQFNDALYNLNEYAKRSPQPLQTWITQIKDELWSIIIQSGKQYLNENWKTMIYLPYQQTIENKYPFANSKQEVNIEDFENFFSPNGNLQRFFREYLMPFVDTSQAQWKIKEIENRQMPINPELIQKLIQSNIITTMFFPNHNSRISTEFSLEKMSLDPVIAKLKLSIGNQSIIDTQEENAVLESFKWPAQDASLWIRTVEGKEFNLNEQGVWGFFRLLEQTNVLNDVNDPSNLQILLEINGNSGRYVLKANQTINPFMPSIFKGFELRERLLG
jgi:intracellular multiplication protein IcmF